MFAADRDVALVVEGIDCAASSIMVRTSLERIDGVKVTHVDGKASVLISRDELQRKLADRSPIVLLEALPEKYFNDGHLPGARQFPHRDLAARARAELPDSNAEIVVYCASATCQNSHMAARELEDLGYRNVAVYAEGKQDWASAGLPLEQAAQ